MRLFVVVHDLCFDKLSLLDLARAMLLSVYGHVVGDGVCYGSHDYQTFIALHHIQCANSVSRYFMDKRSLDSDGDSISSPSGIQSKELSLNPN